MLKQPRQMEGQETEYTPTILSNKQNHIQVQN